MSQSIRAILRTKKVVILHGGLGNQLFQWSYGIGLLKSPSVKEVKFLSMRRNLVPAHTQFELGKFIQSDELSSFANLNLEHSKIVRFLKDPLETRNPLNSARSRIVNTTNEPFTNPEIGVSRKIYLGYYQNTFQVESASGQTLPRISNSMRIKPTGTLEKSIFGRTIVHVRRGDLLTENHRKSLGVLSDNYYSELRNTIADDPIVLTDDLNEAARIAKIIGASAVYGPETFDAFESLRIMSHAKLLVTANSTLSWWGGYLGIRNGNSVIVPSPFFREIKGLEVDTFRIFGASSQKSDFIE